MLDDQVSVYHPTAPLKRRGGIELVPGESGTWTYRYVRCRAEDKVPMQLKSWQRAEMVIAPVSLARLTSSLSSPHRVEVEAKLWSALYGDRAPLSGLPPVLEALVRYHRDAIVCSAAVGDDFGNVTGYSDGAAHGGAFGMNRLNHGAAIFETGWRSQDRRLTETALLWCDNFYDQTIWWGGCAARRDALQQHCRDESDAAHEGLHVAVRHFGAFLHQGLRLLLAGVGGDRGPENDGSADVRKPPMPRSTSTPTRASAAISATSATSSGSTSSPASGSIWTRRCACFASCAPSSPPGTCSTRAASRWTPTRRLLTKTSAD